jgi:tRNA (guanine37-N1)-methyltransferase
MKFYILTLFPDMVAQGLATSILGRAVANGYISIETINIRDFTEDKHKKVDDYPYGGGAGMVMQAQPIYAAWQSVMERVDGTVRTIYLTPQGKTFIQSDAKAFAQVEHLILLCGHYEGVDERVLEEIVTDYISIGDFVLTGGELPAMVLVDAIARMVPGVLSNQESGETESFENHLLEYPQYSRPVEWRGKRVPDILLSGDHAKVDLWRHQQSLQRTLEHRPDLLDKATLDSKDMAFLEQYKENKKDGN